MYPQKPDGQTKNNLLPNVFLIARRDASNQVGPWNNLIQSCLSFKTLMVEQIFLSPQVKRSVIISNKLDYTRCLTSCQTRTLGSLETSVKSQNSIESSPNA